MKLRFLALMMAISLTAGTWASPAAAQFDFMNQDEGPPEPPQEMPPLPEGAQELEVQPEQQEDIPSASNYYQQDQRRQFPPLPPARPCNARDLYGIWELVNVYEEPTGPASANFASIPHQYVMYKKDSIYGKYNSATSAVPASMIEVELDKQQRALHQYLVNESGIIYYYNQGVAVDSMACFIVANRRGPFLVGEMILMPPKGQSETRLVKLYSRYGVDGGEANMTRPGKSPKKRNTRRPVQFPRNPAVFGPALPPPSRGTVQ